VQRRAIAILLAASAALLGLAATRDAIRAPDDGLDGAARRFAGLHGVTAATSSVPRTSATRYVLELPPTGGAVRGGAAEMYLAKALLPASRTTDAAAATLRVRVAPDGTVTVEPLR
jgi:hypothetical protein